VILEVKLNSDGPFGSHRVTDEEDDPEEINETELT